MQHRGCYRALHSTLNGVRSVMQYLDAIIDYKQRICCYVCNRPLLWLAKSQNQELLMSTPPVFCCVFRIRSILDTNGVLGSRLCLWSLVPFSASVMASLLIHLHLCRQLLQDSKSGSDCEPLLTHPPPCGLLVVFFWSSHAQSNEQVRKYGRKCQIDYVLLFPWTTR